MVKIYHSVMKEGPWAVQCTYDDVGGPKFVH